MQQKFIWLSFYHYTLEMSVFVCAWWGGTQVTLMVFVHVTFYETHSV